MRRRLRVAEALLESSGVALASGHRLGMGTSRVRPRAGCGHGQGAATGRVRGGKIRRSPMSSRVPMRGPLLRGWVTARLPSHHVFIGLTVVIGRGVPALPMLASAGLGVDWKFCGVTGVLEVRRWIWRELR